MILVGNDILKGGREVLMNEFNLNIEELQEIQVSMEETSSFRSRSKNDIW